MLKTSWLACKKYVPQFNPIVQLYIDSTLKVFRKLALGGPIAHISDYVDYVSFLYNMFSKT